MNRPTIRLLAAAAALILLAGCGKAEEKKAEAPAAAQRTVNITTAQATGRDMPMIEETVGRLEDDRATTLAAEVPGTVVLMAVEEGESVRRGQLLARLDAADMQAAANINSAQLQVQQKQVERLRVLAAKQFVSQSALEQAEAQLTAMREQSSTSKHNVGRTEIRAPFNGVVQARFAAAGDYLGVGKPILTLAGSGGELAAVIPFPETESRLKVGQKVRLHLAADPDTVVESTISQLTPMVGEGSGSFEARARLAHAAGWRAGGSVVAEVILAEKSGAVAVPQAALVLRPAGEVVYLLAGNKVKAQAVRSGVVRDGWVEIVAGLHGGETVAAEGAAFLTDGASVRIANSDAKPAGAAQ